MHEKLKKEWTRVTLGDVVQLCRERSSDPAGDGFDRYVGLEHLDPGDLKIRRWGNIADGTTFTSVFRARQVLFGKRRAYQRKVGVADFDGVCSGDIYVLEPKNDCLLPELLPFICQTEGFFEHAVGTSAGSLSPRTNWESLASYEFALPPLREQGRIAEVLSSGHTNTESLRLASGRLLTLRRAMQNELLFSAPYEGQEETALLADVAFIDPSDPPLPSDAAFIPMDCVSEWQRTIARFEERGNRGGVRAAAGDVLMARITPCLENGKIAQVPIHIARCGGSTEFIVLRAKEDTDRSYLYWLVSSDRIRNAAVAMMSGSTGRQRVSGAHLAGVRIARIQPAEQVRLGQLINEVESDRVALMRRHHAACKLQYVLVNSLVGRGEQ